MTANCEERGGGFFFGERDRQTRFEIRSCLFFSRRRRQLSSEEQIKSAERMLSLESMSVIARYATFVATKTSLKQQFAVNNRSSVTKIVRYAIKERKRWEECLHLIILRFCDWFFFFFGSLNWTENGGKTTSYYALFSLVVYSLPTTTFFIIIITLILRILTILFSLLCAHMNHK